MVERLTSAFVVTAALLTVACGPKAVDMRPFAEQTEELATAVADSGRSTVVLMRQAEALDDATRLARGRALAESPSAASALAAQWRQTLGVMGALTSYARSLAALREAADEADVAVRGSVASLNSLGAVVGLPALPPALVGAAAKAYAAIAERQAGAQQLEAMGQVQAHVEQIGQAVGEQLGELRTLIDSAEALAETSLDNTTNAWRTYYLHLAGERDLLTSYLERYQEVELLRERGLRLRSIRAFPALVQQYAPSDEAVAALVDEKREAGGCEAGARCIDDALIGAAIARIEKSATGAAAELAQLAFGSESDTPQALVSRLGDAHANWMKRVHFVRGELVHYEPAYVRYATELDAIRANAAAAREWAASTAEAVAAWVEVHGDLKRALAEESGVTVTDLVVAISQIRFAYEDLRKESK